LKVLAKSSANNENLCHALAVAYLLAIAAGLITSAAFHPMHFWPAMPIGLFLLLKLNKSESFKARILLNFLFGIAFQIITLYWVGTYVGSFAWIALVLMQATFLILLSFTNGAIAFAVAWVAYEFVLRSFPFGGFGWSRIGYALTQSPLNYLYPRISIVGVAFLVVLSLALLLEKRFKALVILLPIYLVIGLIPVSVADTGTLKVGLVQGGQNLKLDNTFENSEGAIGKHFLATKKIKAGSVDLVIWPENAVMHDPFARKQTNLNFNAEVARIKAPILVNANLSDGTNGSVIIGDGLNQSYSKRYLTPFGEFIPLRSVVEKITDKADLVIGYKPGEDAYLFSSGTKRFRTLICYELLSDKQARKEMADADFIVVQTNNATYYGTWQLDQELAIAQARSAETSRQSAYVSTTGGTSLIDERGQVFSSIPKYSNQVLIGEIETRQGATPASKFGSSLEILIIALWLFFLGKTSRAFRR
jgi:apolipoprotein N-acyltransferase